MSLENRKSSAEIAILLATIAACGTHQKPKHMPRWLDEKCEEARDEVLIALEGQGEIGPAAGDKNFQQAVSKMNDACGIAQQEGGDIVRVLLEDLTERTRHKITCAMMEANPDTIPTICGVPDVAFLVQKCNLIPECEYGPQPLSSPYALRINEALPDYVRCTVSFPQKIDLEDPQTHGLIFGCHLGKLQSLFNNRALFNNRGTLRINMKKKGLVRPDGTVEHDTSDYDPKGHDRFFGEGRRPFGAGWSIDLNRNEIYRYSPLAICRRNSYYEKPDEVVFYNHVCGSDAYIRQTPYCTITQKISCPTSQIQRLFRNRRLCPPRTHE